MLSTEVIKAANWNEQIDDFTEMFWEANTSQFWLDTEIPVSKDTNDWKKLSPEQQDTYKKVFGGLTLLDTLQGIEGMPFIADKIEGLKRKSVLIFMAMAENIHQKSYSTIFTTLLDNTNEISEVFEWVETNPIVQYKAKRIAEYYRNIETKEDLYMAMVASQFLEGFLFWSGFFYPLYMAGQGKMNSTGEMISLIVRDEQIHAVYLGLLARELRETFDNETVERLNKETFELLDDLLENEKKYTHSLYNKIGLDSQVNEFLLYNANKVMDNLDLPHQYKETEINPIVENGLQVKTKMTDMFSVKGASYFKAKIVEVTDETFDFSDR